MTVSKVTKERISHGGGGPRSGPATYRITFVLTSTSVPAISSKTSGRGRRRRATATTEAPAELACQQQRDDQLPPTAVPRQSFIRAHERDRRGMGWQAGRALSYWPMRRRSVSSWTGQTLAVMMHVGPGMATP
jgi:hypothetical protein